MINFGMNRKLVLLFLLIIFAAAASAIVINFKRRLILGTVTFSTTIGEPKLTIFGWAPAQSQVKLDGLAVADTTTAAADGSFLISRVYLPPSSLYPEICLQAHDAIGRTTQPTCLPRLETGHYNYTVGPVLLSPTLSLEKGEIIKGEAVAASGKTTPNTEVDIFLARTYSLPKYQIKSDKGGNFEFNLPTEAVDEWRVFAGAGILGSNSPKSHTLTFRIHPPFYSFWEIIKYILELLSPYLIYIIIFIEVLILTFLLLKRHGHPLR